MQNLKRSRKSSDKFSGRVKTRRSQGPRKRQYIIAFAAPAALFLALFSIYPLLQLLRMSVSSVTAATLHDDWTFTGMDNLISGFSSGETNAALGRTAIFVFIVTVVGMVGGFIAAVALRSAGRWANVILAIMVFAWALPPVVSGSVWKFLLADSGLVNLFGKSISILDDPVPFLYDGRIALISIAFVNAWAVLPFNALVFRAALLNIETEIFEAAALDGAPRWREVWNIMVPAVRPTMVVLLVLTIVHGFRSFDFIYVMTYGGPGQATSTLPFLAYLQAFVRYSFGLGAATSVLTALLVGILAVVYARIIRQEESE